MNNQPQDTLPSEVPTDGAFQMGDQRHRDVQDPALFMKREQAANANILEKALSVTRGDRQEAYGSPMENWTATVGIFNAMTGRDLSPSEGVKFAIAMKLARLKNSPYHRDSMVDLAGYAWVYSEVAQ